MIEIRLGTHFIEATGCAISTPTTEQWDAILDGLGPNALFGWSTPIDNDEPGLPPFIVPFCPEIIARQTENLDDEDLDQYLMVIEWTCDRHVTYWMTDPDPDERQRKIESELYDRFPASLATWGRIQGDILDRAERISD